MGRPQFFHAGFHARGVDFVHFHPIADATSVYAGSGALGGAEPWAQLLVGALATYRVHSSLTGDDIRPSNKAYRP